MRAAIGLTLALWGGALLVLTGVLNMARAQPSDLPWLVFESYRDGTQALYRVRLDGRGLQRLTQTDGDAYFHSWSPDGGWLYFFSYQSGLCRMRMVDARPVCLGRGSPIVPTRATPYVWSPDGEWLAFIAYALTPSGLTQHLARMTPDGRQVELLTRNPDGRFLAVGGQNSVVWSGDAGRLYFYYYVEGVPRLYTVSAKGGGEQPLAGALPNRQLVAQSPDGAWLALSSYDLTTKGDLYRAGPDGSDLRALTRQPTQEEFETISPDGQWVIFTVKSDDDRRDLFSARADGSERRSLADLGGSQRFRVWSPDGTWLYFVHEADLHTIHRVRPDGSGLQALTAPLPPIGALLWSSDGDWLYFLATTRRETADLYRMPAEGGDLQKLAEGLVEPPLWSPDGQWLVYAANRPGYPVASLFRLRPDGTGERALASKVFIYRANSDDQAAVWAPQVEFRWRLDWMIIGSGGGLGLGLVLGMLRRARLA